jgi:activator of 2-hydroxyglutaryl-CoA dehydratase
LIPCAENPDIQVIVATVQSSNGGMANNPCKGEFLGEKMSRKVLIPEGPRFVGALGAALLAAKNHE